MTPELAMLRQILRDAHPSFGRIDEILIQLALDETVSPEVFDLICEAIFVALLAYAEVVSADV